jgi:hypothetical protein
MATIRELIALAERTGFAKAALGSAEEARLFRFAIYSFRRANEVGLELSITLDDNEVVLRKRQCPSIEILPTPSAGE